MTRPIEPTPTTPPPGGPELRIGNAEREATVARLQLALTEGRLEIAEVDERMAAAYSARTAGELAPITADLPAAGPSAPAPAATKLPRGRERERHRSRVAQGRVEQDEDGDRWLFWAWRAWASAVLINLVIWFAVSLGNGFDVYFWPIWVAGPWGAILLVNTLFRRLN